MPAEYWDLNLQPEPMWLTLPHRYSSSQAIPKLERCSFSANSNQGAARKTNCANTKRLPDVFKKNHCLPYTNLCGECCLLTLAPQKTLAVPALG